VISNPPPNVIKARVSNNLFSGNALQYFCDDYYLQELFATGMTSICDPLCFDSSVLVSIASVSLCSEVLTQKNALVSLYNNTDGDNWFYNSNWNSGLALKEWYGVSQSGSNVDIISLPYNYLVGRSIY
jgi:hypothetical protein